MPRNIERLVEAGQSNPSSCGMAPDAVPTFDRALIDHAYDNTAAFPDVPEWREAWRRRSQAVSTGTPARLDIKYGLAPAQRLDVFPHSDPAPATAVFVHGGFWSRNSKETFRFLVDGIHASGLNAVFVGHTLAPSARMDQMVEEVRVATRWVFGHLKEFNFASRPLIVIGWSSGAQLAAMTMGESQVAAGLGISGIYDLEPLRHASINDVLKLERDEAQRNSPTFNLPPRSGPFVVAHGANELAAFCKQSNEFFGAWTSRDLSGRLIPLPGRHHHSVLEELYLHEGRLTAVLASLAAA